MLTALMKNRPGGSLLLSWKLCLLFIWFPVFTYAQGVDMGYRIPIEMTPSPEAASLGKYGNIPVSYFTGTPEISIPLFDIKDGDLTIPVKLSYHASGIKVNDVASWAGLGWALVSGGIINRKVNHMPDEDSSEKIPTIQELRQNPNYEFLLNYSDRSLTYQHDLQPDEFTYSFMGYYGKFYMDRDKKTFLNPHNDLKIEFYGIDYFRIKTPDGYQYVFGASEGGFFNSPSIDADPTEINYTATTSWFMSAVVSASGDTVCRFKYEKLASEIAYYDVQYYAVVGDVITCGLPVFKPYDKTYRYETTTQMQQICLKEITYNQGKIVFESTVGREDKNKGGCILDAMKVYAGGELKKWFVFKHGYFYSDKGKTYFNYTGECGKYRLRLDELVEKDVNGVEVKKYRFEYNPELLPPYGNFGVDIWGFYNGSEYNSTLCYWEKCQQKIYKDYDVSFYPGSRNPNEQKMQACMLTRINYPTKGYTDFEYESNRHDDTINSVPHLLGGLRIRSIKNYDHNGNLLISKEYKYGKNENGYGQLICPYVRFERNACLREVKIPFLSARCEYYIPSQYTLLSVASHPLDVPSMDPGEVIFYPYVSEYIREGDRLVGKRCFEFDFVPDAFTFEDYERVITNYRYANRGWKRGNLLKESIYSGEENDHMQLVYQKENEYREFAIGQLFGLSIASKYSVDTYDYKLQLEYYSICQKYEYAAVKKVIGTTENFYTQEGTISKRTRYKYGRLDRRMNFTQPTEITEYVGSDSVRTVLKYPFDFDGVVYKEMQDNYILPVIEEQVYKNNVFLSNVKTNYMKWLNHFVPSSIEMKQGTTPSETRLRYVRYNKGGKPVYVIKDDYTKVVYLWGYHNQYPVAEIKNASYDEVLKIIPEDKIEYIADQAYSANQMSYYLNLLYEGLPGAQVNLATFDPVWGVSSLTNPQKINTFFDYDTFGRLQKSYYRTGGANQVIESYDYHYKP